MKRLVMVGLLLLTVPSFVSALQLSAAQENYCVQMGSLAVSVGEARDAQAPRSEALLLTEHSAYLSPALRTWAAGLVFWVYGNTDLRGSDLYVPIVVSCRSEIARQETVRLQNQMHADMGSVCEVMAGIGTIIAAGTWRLTQSQAIAELKDVDSQYASRAEWYKKLVPFVYQRKHMTPVALRVAVTQQCLNDLAEGMAQAEGVRR